MNMHIHEARAHIRTGCIDDLAVVSRHLPAKSHNLLIEIEYSIIHYLFVMDDPAIDECFHNDIIAKINAGFEQKPKSRNRDSILGEKFSCIFLLSERSRW